MLKLKLSQAQLSQLYHEIKRSIGVVKLSEMCKIKRSTLYMKLRGERPFYFDELQNIEKILKEKEDTKNQLLELSHSKNFYWKV